MERLLTPRLVIEPMTESELLALIESCRISDPELSEAYTDMLSGCRAHPEQRLWYTAWRIALPGGTMAGDLCFKGLPESGRPEIGYGIIAEFQGRGYATEAVGAACKWALAHPGVTAVEAETAPGNAASRRVLKKLGFVPTGVMGEEGPRFELLPA